MRRPLAETVSSRPLLGAGRVESPMLAKRGALSRVWVRWVAGQSVVHSPLRAGAGIEEIRMRKAEEHQRADLPYDARGIQRERLVGIERVHEEPLDPAQQVAGDRVGIAGPSPAVVDGGLDVLREDGDDVRV